MIFWTLDAMALRDEAYLTSAWQQHSRSGSGRGRGAWKAPAGAPQSDSGALRYRRLLLAGREDADTWDILTCGTTGTSKGVMKTCSCCYFERHHCAVRGDTRVDTRESAPRRRRRVHRAAADRTACRARPRWCRRRRRRRKRMRRWGRRRSAISTPSSKVRGSTEPPQSPCPPPPPTHPTPPPLAP
jgi:hypothetical protein